MITVISFGLVMYMIFTNIYTNIHKYTQINIIYKYLQLLTIIVQYLQLITKRSQFY